MAPVSVPAPPADDAPHLLVVDDDRRIRDLLSRYLTSEGYRISTAETAADARAKLSGLSFDLLILDVMMPGETGFEFAKSIRKSSTVPILMLTARDAVSDRIDGLDAGADDYLVKPFDVGELKARLRALLRRSGETVDEDLAFAELTLDPGRHGVAVGDSFAELTRTEYQLLELLLRNPNRVLPHDLIYERVWGYDFGPTSNALRVYVGYLRRKLEDAGARPLIHTLRGVGYVLREPA
jgi:two-component system, OmpR family, response regulator MprA